MFHSRDRVVLIVVTRLRRSLRLGFVSGASAQFSRTPLSAREFVFAPSETIVLVGPESAGLQNGHERGHNRTTQQTLIGLSETRANSPKRQRDSGRH